MHAFRSIVAALLLSVFAGEAFLSPALADGFDKIVLSSEEGADTTETTFTADTPEIFLSAVITDAVLSGSKLAVDWIAVDTGGAAPENYRIAKKNFDVGMLDNRLDASITKPTNSWPAGTYEVELIVDGKVMETVGFKVE